MVKHKIKMLTVAIIGEGWTFEDTEKVDFEICGELDLKDVTTGLLIDLEVALKTKSDIAEKQNSK